MKKKNPYAALGVAQDASEDAIRKAYRDLARKHHPDLNPSDPVAEERFKEVSEAYEVLSDPERRRSYDEFGDIAFDANFDAEAARQARGPFGNGVGGNSFGGFEDLFQNVFERGHGHPHSRRPRRMRGSDIEVGFELDFLQAVLGGERNLQIRRPMANGTQKTDTVTIRIPPGVADGGQLRIPRKGGEGVNGGPPGDLLAKLRVQPHPLFRRVDRDIHFDLPITLREALFGAKVEVPTLEGRATLTVPPETDSGVKLRLRGKGIPDPSGKKPGDLYVTLQVCVPKELDDEAKEQLQDLLPDDPSEIRKDLLK